jgi:hypothetical protein
MRSPTCQTRDSRVSRSREWGEECLDKRDQCRLAIRPGSQEGADVAQPHRNLVGCELSGTDDEVVVVAGQVVGERLTEGQMEARLGGSFVV